MGNVRNGSFVVMTIVVLLVSIIGVCGFAQTDSGSTRCTTESTEYAL